MNLHLDDVAKLEASFAQLKSAYERFFLGIDRTPPEREHEAFKLALRQAHNARAQGAQLKLRMQNLLAQNISYEQLWTRQLTTREQAGKLGIRRAPAPVPAESRATTASAASTQPPLRSDDKQTTEGPIASPLAAPPSSAAVSDASLARVWQALVEQHQRLNQPHPPAWSSWRSTMLTQIQTMQSISGAPQVSLQLVIDGGVPSVRVVPKK